MVSKDRVSISKKHVCRELSPVDSVSRMFPATSRMNPLSFEREHQVVELLPILARRPGGDTPSSRCSRPRRPERPGTPCPRGGRSA